jgi:hypothetical protein
MHHWCHGLTPVALQSLELMAATSSATSSLGVGHILRMLRRESSVVHVLPAKV